MSLHLRRHRPQTRPPRGGLDFRRKSGVLEFSTSAYRRVIVSLRLASEGPAFRKNAAQRTFLEFQPHCTSPH
jgi:hypothetical protein